MLHTYTIRSVCSPSFWSVNIVEDGRRTVWSRSGSPVVGDTHMEYDNYSAAYETAERLIPIYQQINAKPLSSGCYEHEDKLAAMGFDA